VVIGVAGDGSADAKAFGVSTMTGCLHHTTTAAMHDGLVGIECLPQRMEGETHEFFVHMEVDTLRGALRFRHDEAASWVDSRVKLSEAVRPWARVEAEHAADVMPSVRLVSHSRSSPLNAIEGLERIVAGLPVAKQSMALAWCETEGLYDCRAIAAVGACDDFVGALDLSHADERKVRQRLEGGRASAPRRSYASRERPPVPSEVLLAAKRAPAVQPRPAPRGLDA